MKRKEFQNLFKKKVVLLDGAFGTELQKKGMPLGICPEKWVLENSEILIKLQQDYVSAGADIIYSCTFGLNYFKLKEFGLENEVYDLNKKLVALSKKAAGEKALVAGDISSTGKFVKPFGEIEFEDMVNIFKSQVKGLLDGGVDLFVIETIMDLQEARAALIAVKETCDLPVMVSMTFTDNGLTLTGTDPVSALITLQSLGADAVGANCSTGPDDMAAVIATMKPYAKVPILAKPNAGIPKLINGKTIFSMNAENFVAYIPALIKAGVNLVGGCCGTNPDYIKLINKKIKNKIPLLPKITGISAICSSKKTQFISSEKGILVIGERINPTGKKTLQEELKNKVFTEVRAYAKEQETKGAKALDVNVGMSGINETEIMLKAMDVIQHSTKLPLCIDSANIETLEAALRVYPGRALINSISAEKHKLEKLLPIVGKYGAMFILLPLNEKVVPEKAKQRIEIIKKIFKEAQKYNFKKEDILVDGLVMAISSNQDAALETLKVIETCTNKLGFQTIVGLSNISFGLPERQNINAAFLAAATIKGLSAAILNPSHELLMAIKMAMDVILLKDKNSKVYIEHFLNLKDDSIKKENSTRDHLNKKEWHVLIYEAILDGDKDVINSYIQKALAEKNEPDLIINNDLIPAIQKVEIFLIKKNIFCLN